MKEIKNKWVGDKIVGDKFMHEMHLRQPRFTYSVFWPYT